MLTVGGEDAGDALDSELESNSSPTLDLPRDEPVAARVAGAVGVRGVARVPEAASKAATRTAAIVRPSRNALRDLIISLQLDAVSACSPAACSPAAV